MSRQQRRFDQKQARSGAPAMAVGGWLAAALRHHEAGRWPEAETLYRRVLDADPAHADGLHLLGVLAHQRGEHARAVALITRAIAVAPQVAACHANLGLALRALGRIEEAIACYRTALELTPAFPEACNSLGSALGDLGRLDEAVACFRRAAALRPDYPEAQNNLGTALQEQGRMADAITRYRKAIALRPDYVEAHGNLADALRNQERLDEAIACCRRAIGLQPDAAEAHHNLALALLTRGDMEEGWREYEWRWKTPQMAADAPRVPQPQWRGEAAPGRTLLIHAEQGFGDALQFCRYATLAAASGLRVVLEVQQSLVRLLSTLAGVERVVARGAKRPTFDLHCPMLSLPLALGTTVDTIPAPGPYLHADASEAAAWRTRLGADRGGPLVGIVWAGDPCLHSPALAAVDRRRSLAPEQLAPLLELAGPRFVSLQRSGARAAPNLKLLDLMHEVEDFADTAALIAGLDLVISADTAVAHLAAAMGKPVWLLNRFGPCWRWLLGRRDSPWYPTLRLYRQPSPGDWGAVIAEVARDLRGWEGPSAASGRTA